MRVLFMGTAPFACPTLQQLMASPHEVVAVVTQPDRPRGRGRQPAMSAVKMCALEHDIPVLQPHTLRTPEAVQTLAALHPDAIVVVAYGHILPPTVLALPSTGCFNVHASLLPKYRGPAPINWALINGETETGYTIIQMDAQIDTGPMLHREVCPITLEDDAISVGERLAVRGAAGMLHVLNALQNGTLTGLPQPTEGASSAPKLTPELGQLVWDQPATVLHNLIRGLVPWPGAKTHYDTTELKVWRASVHATPPTALPGTITAVTTDGILVACATDHVLVQDVQPANRRRMAAHAFAQGYRVQQGQCFA